MFFREISGLTVLQVLLLIYINIDPFPVKPRTTTKPFLRRDVRNRAPSAARFHS